MEGGSRHRGLGFFFFFFPLNAPFHEVVLVKNAIEGLIHETLHFSNTRWTSCTGPPPRMPDFSIFLKTNKLTPTLPRSLSPVSLLLFSV
ncbi:hypothetical protein I3842_15G163200 [Carya illinoinensis]|uniref:Secreted protein n=1 Tax=Carya illinoinensis TaxID=32201 RepID=A0A922A9W2_CARIL|nr:hypothetical protein I3842_15G163200 [Carya illinoinensis]